MDDLMDSLGDAKEQDRIYQKAQMQIDKILDPDSRVPPLYTEPRKRLGRGRVCYLFTSFNTCRLIQCNCVCQWQRKAFSQAEKKAADEWRSDRRRQRQTYH